MPDSKPDTTVPDLTILRPKRMEIALRRLVYEITHLSAENDDGSHECRISAEALRLARGALKETP